MPTTGSDALAPKLSDADLHRRFDTLRTERVAQRRFDAIRSLVRSTVLLVFAVLLFVWHWVWLRRYAKGATEDV